MSKKVYLLDATIRDGGQGLEAGFKSDLYPDVFNDKIIKSIIDLEVESNVDMVELGCMAPSDEDEKKFAIYQNIEELSKTMPKNLKEGQQCIGLYTGPDTPIEDIPDWNPTLCKNIRVILRYSQLKKSLDYCAALSKKGYTMFVQPMLTMRYSDEELDMCINAANEMGAFALYFVDSYGYMEPKDVKRLYEYYNPRLNKDIKIGFHSHNNMNLAYSNVRYFLDLVQDRDVIIDACATGMGQGAGNIQTELIVPYLNEKFGKNYNYDAVLDICEILENEYIKDNEWGYSTTRLLPAIHKCAYKYALIFRKKYGLKFKDINKILSNMSYDEKQRYTAELAEEIVSKFRKAK